MGGGWGPREPKQLWWDIKKTLAIAPFMTEVIGGDWDEHGLGCARRRRYPVYGYDISMLSVLTVARFVGRGLAGEAALRCDVGVATHDRGIKPLLQWKIVANIRARIDWVYGNVDDRRIL